MRISPSDKFMNVSLGDKYFSVSQNDKYNLCIKLLRDYPSIGVAHRALSSNTIITK